MRTDEGPFSVNRPRSTAQLDTTNTVATKFHYGAAFRIPSPPLEERARERRPFESKFPCHYTGRSAQLDKWIVKLWILIGLLACCASASMAGDPPKIIIAHRGGSGYLREHTLPGKALAHAMGADYLEQDLVLSKDAIPVVLHDIYLDTVTDVAKRFPDRKRADGRYYALDFTVAELKQLQVTERFDRRTGKAVFPGRFPLWQGSFQIPTFEEELQFIQGLNRTIGREAGIYPEIKAPAWHRKQGVDLSPIVLGVLERYGYRTKADKVFLQCFDYQEVKRLRTELGYRGRLIQLLAEPISSEPGTDFAFLTSRAGLEELAKVAD